MTKEMQKWLSQVPALKLLCGVLISFCFAILFNIDSLVLLIVLGMSLLLSFIFIKLERNSLAWAVLVLASGFWLASQKNDYTDYSINKILADEPAIIEGRIIDIISQKENYMKCLLCGSYDSKSLPKLENQKIVLTIYGDNIIVKKGHIIAANVYARPPKDALLPDDFPEKQFLRSLDAQWIASGKSANVSVLDYQESAWEFIDGIANTINQRVDILFSKNTSGIVKALLTGNKSSISYETKQEFSYTGTAHVLAVSGLHVGLIALILFLLLGFVRNIKLKFIIYSLALIVFVMITGYQTSAQRACFMAILFMFANTIQRKTNIVNTLSFSVLILIFFQPSLIYSAGFQMSVFSVMGIAIFIKPVEKTLAMLFNTKKPQRNFILSSFALSISAGIAVSPVVAYYFGVYSIISPLANLLVVPLTSLAFILSVITLILSLISMDFAAFYANSADLIIKLTLEINKFSADLPFSHIKSGAAFALSIIISLAIIYIIYSKSRKMLASRFIISIISSFLLLVFLSANYSEGIRVIPRDNYVSLFIPVSNNQDFLLISDRRPKQKPRNDFAMLSYLSNYPKDLIIGYTGNNGIKLCDDLKKNKYIKTFEVSSNMQKKINSIFYPNEFIPQIINTVNK